MNERLCELCGAIPLQKVTIIWEREIKVFKKEFSFGKAVYKGGLHLKV